MSANDGVHEMTLENLGVDRVRTSKLLELIGVSIMQYQQIELYLKILLPHMKSKGSDESEPNEFQWRKLLDGRDTLGTLFKKLKGVEVAGDEAALEKYLRALADQRNEIVHHFFSKPIGQIQSAEQVEAAIVHVRAAISFAKPFEESLRRALEQFADALGQSIAEEEAALIADSLQTQRH